MRHHGSMADRLGDAGHHGSGPRSGSDEVNGRAAARLLHVIVGHKLRHHFLNAIDSVLQLAPRDDLLVIDNASDDPLLTRSLDELADSSRVTVWHRLTNNVDLNGKVGELYVAYTEAFTYAIASGYDYIHLIQGDMQLVWWEPAILEEAQAIYARQPRCVNVVTLAMSSDSLLGDDWQVPEPGEDATLRKYGMTDTGLYHLDRWRGAAIPFGPSEQVHGGRALDRGMVVVLHPWPSMVPVPWPPVVRNGLQQGRDPVRPRPLFCRPLSPFEAAAVRGRSSRAPLEQVCIPWGWWCLSPMWVSDVADPYYWVLRYKGARHQGLRAFLPRPDRRGVEGEGWRALLRHPHRPSLVALVLRPASALLRLAVRRLRAEVDARVGRLDLRN